MLNLVDLEGEEWARYCEQVWNAIDEHDSNRAWRQWDVGSGFWNKPWHSR